MVRALLLILLVAASAMLYQTKRTQRVEYARERAAAERASGGAGEGALERPESPMRTTPRATLEPRGADRNAPPQILPSLDVDQREDLRDALEEWGPIPDAILTAEVDEAGRREIAVAAFRALLGNLAREDRARSGLDRARRVSLRSGEEVLFLGVQHVDRAWTGRTVAGDALSIPTTAVIDSERLTVDEARAARSAIREERIPRALADREPGALSRLLRDALIDDDVERAEELFSAWITTAGPTHLAEEIEDADRRHAYRSLARSLGPQGSPASSAASVASAPPTPTPRAARSTGTLAELEAFLEHGHHLRALSSDERKAALLACERWDGWITERIETGDDLSGDLPKLLRELRTLRHDLVKTSGF